MLDETLSLVPTAAVVEINELNLDHFCMVIVVPSLLILSVPDPNFFNGQYFHDQISVQNILKRKPAPNLPLLTYRLKQKVDFLTCAVG